MLVISFHGASFSGIGNAPSFCSKLATAFFQNVKLPKVSAGK